MREVRVVVLGVVASAAALAFWLTQPERAADAAQDAQREQLGQILPTVGRPAPPMAARTVTGRTIDLRELRGHPVWVTFGATWCPPCRAEAPDIDQVSTDHAAEGLVVVAVYLGQDAETVAGFTDRLGLDYAAVPDPDRLIGALFGVRGLPTHVFIGPDGTVASIRIASLSRAEMESEVAAIAR